MQYMTNDEAEQTFHFNDTISYHLVIDGDPDEPGTGSGAGRAAVKEIHLIGGKPFLELLPVGAAHTVRMPAYVGVEVVHKAMDLAELTAFIGAEPHDQAAVAAFTGERDGYKFSLDEAMTIAQLWGASIADE